MTTVWRSLLWKEWREQRWILLGILAIAALGPAPFAWRNADNYRVGLVMMGSMFIPLASLFVGAWIAAGERSRRTIDFLQALPVPMAAPARAKLLCAAGVVLAPGLIAWAIGGIWSWQHRAQLETREFAEVVIMLTTMSLLPLSIMLWSAFFGANLSDEIRAGVVALAGISLCWCFLALIGYVIAPDTADWPEWLRFGVALLPGSPIAGPTFTPNQRGVPLVIFATLTVCAHLVVGTFFVRRFGRQPLAIPSPSGSKAPVIAQQRWLAPPRRSPLFAIAWKQWRETFPIAGMGLLAILGTTALLAIVIARMEMRSAAGSTKDAAYVAWITIGFAVAIVGGISLLHEDLRPEMNTFWRSRPIPVKSWFTIKLLTGLLTTMAFLLAVPVVVMLTLSATGAVTWSQNDTVPFAIMCGATLAFHGCGFLIALAATAVFRRATVAALISVLTTVLALYLVDLLEVDPHTDLPLLAGAAAIAATTSIGIAWFSVKKDWRVG